MLVAQYSVDKLMKKFILTAVVSFTVGLIVSMAMI